MKQYLTANHQLPPVFFDHQDLIYRTSLMVARGDLARLAQFGVYPHETAPEIAPCGYTDWQLDGDGCYRRWPIAGTDNSANDGIVI